MDHRDRICIKGEEAHKRLQAGIRQQVTLKDMKMLATVRMMLNALAKDGIRGLAPLALRKWMAIWLHRQDWIEVSRRSWWSTELLRDCADHLSPSRRLFFADLCRQVQALGLHPDEVGSVLEVGCSLGHQLRYVETELFPSAARLDGLDIDAYAIRAGTEYLRAVGSHVSLRCGDIRQLDEFVGQRMYDVIFCTRTLLNLKEADAAAVVRMMLAHSRIMVALAGLAHPAVDNAHLIHSDVRSRDATWVHNFGQMVKVAGGRVVGRRWEGDREVEGQTSYFVFAVPPVVPTERRSTLRNASGVLESSRSEHG